MIIQQLSTDWQLIGDKEVGLWHTLRWLEDQDFIVLDFFVGGRSCGRKRCVREINVCRAGDPVHAGDKALTRETPMEQVYKRVINWQNFWFFSEWKGMPRSDKFHWKGTSMTTCNKPLLQQDSFIWKNQEIPHN
jgi:hypothetical protein